MARVLLVGCGPLPDPAEERIGFPQLRTEQTLGALLRAGHRVRAVLLGERAAPRALRRSPAGEAEIHCVRPESGAWLEEVAEARRSFAPDAVVSAGPYEPAKAAALTVGEEPLWVDVPGDPFAEARARSAHLGEPDASVWMRAAWAPAFARGDAFGVISAPQRLALLGQLGWLGRLEQAPPDHDWVGEIPVAAPFSDLPELAPRPAAPGGDLVFALAGGFNTWMDGPALLEGLLFAMARHPGLRLVCTGGEIPGHHTAGYADFRAGALASPFAERFAFHGWVRQEKLPEILRSAHVGLCLDRPSLEPELGTRTRLFFFSQLGLGLAASPVCALARELAAEGHLCPLPLRDGPGVGEALLRLARAGQDPAKPAAAWAWMRARYAPERVFSPLLRWLEAPRRTAPGRDASADLARELAQARQELARIHRTPTWRLSAAIASALHRKK